MRKAQWDVTVCAVYLPKVLDTAAKAQRRRDPVKSQ